MSNPYRDRPAYSFWKSGVAETPWAELDPVIAAPFVISRGSAVATAGSCFAQHISRTLVERGFHYLVTESFQGRTGTTDENYGVFPARFGNLYTARQLVQLFDRAYGLWQPETDAWVGKQGGFIDPFRPRIQDAGYATIELLQADRERHFEAVRRMFEDCDLFIFTLGLTEAWISPRDGSVFPLAPGVVSPDAGADAAQFHNFGVTEVIADLDLFMRRFRTVNADARVMLTVSPVALIATYEDRHVLTSTIASKSILRAAAEDLTRRDASVAYFPSYEIIIGPPTASRYYAPDLREVTPDGVVHVMSVFSRHYLASDGGGTANDVPAPRTNTESSGLAHAGSHAPSPLSEEDRLRLSDVAGIVCDEEAIVSS